MRNNESAINFKFETFATMHGIGAASGLIWEDGKLFLVSDDSDVLYCYHPENKQLEKISLLESGDLLENRPKPEKSDYESITQDENHFYIFGSGSTQMRNTLAIVSKEDFSVSVKSLDSFYQFLKTSGQVNDENFNIEGAIIHSSTLFLFNRGNGPKRQNGVFEISHWENENRRVVQFHSVSLPTIQNSQYGFTDAILAEGNIYFLAAAEAVASTYEDGEILGSIIGRMNLKTYAVETTQFITPNYKLEGITLYKKDKNFLHFLVCEDPDDGQMMSEVFELKINR